MACVENIPPANGDSEMEEGEIVDELDDLSDISSEEEFLLRQRLQVLENYNNVLERKKAKNSSVGPGKTEKCVDLLPQDLSEISASDNEEVFPRLPVNRNNNNARNIRHKKRKAVSVASLGKKKEIKNKSHRAKKKLVPKVVPESSDESDDEYRNKRRRLANAVVVHTPKSDSSTLRARLRKMFGTQNLEPIKTVVQEQSKQNEVSIPIAISENKEDIKINNNVLAEKTIPPNIINEQTKICELIDLCNDEEVMVINDTVDSVLKLGDADAVFEHDTVDGVPMPYEVPIKEIPAADIPNSAKVNTGDSDEDLELLRQYALKTKTNKVKLDQLQNSKTTEVESKPQILSEDEDSDTAELRLICLKSALLKKAIEMKRKQKMRKRLSQSIHDDFILDDENVTRKIEAENNTDIESVDMDIGSDGDEKCKETPVQDHNHVVENMNQITEFDGEYTILKDVPLPSSPAKEEIDEDEDLLRAKLLTSLSKNWSSLVGPTITENTAESPTAEAPTPPVKKKVNLPPEKPFIIKLGESDSEGEHEATKNLTKMHMKLSEQMDFQQKLDMFLKSTRMEVEKQKLPDVVQQPPEQAKPVPKYVAKTVRHLPKSEQIEYKNLVKRMAELEKIKQARQTSMNLNKALIPTKETLKPRNISIDTSKNNLEQQIALSRKKIAEESAKMMKLKEEATNLSQKYKIAATELRNLTTAITFNKKQQRTVQSRLTKIRLQHQTLIKSSSTNNHSKPTPIVIRNTNRNLTTMKLQKENDPTKEEYKNQLILKSVKVSVKNDLKDDTTSNSRLSVQVDVSSNKKTVKIPKSPTNERIVDFTRNAHNSENVSETNKPIVEKGGGEENKNQEDKICRQNNVESHSKETDDYISPLEALHSGNWAEDPNSILCPFEVGGSCKDPDCKYLHPKIPSNQ